MASRRAPSPIVPRGPGWAIEYIMEEVRLRARWAGYFADFRPPFAHFTPDQYRAMAERNGLLVHHILVEYGSWDFQSLQGLIAFCAATFVEWTRKVPEPDRADFLIDVLDHYRAAACHRPGEENVFKFRQMEVALTRPAG